MDGILNFNKPGGWTSHDAVAYLRRLLHQKRIGHAGTLDPLATGVLLLCLGQATRMAEYLMASSKVYLARLRLGVTTDTYDAAGVVTGTRDVQVDAVAVRAILPQFVGHIDQVPPMYSALKHDGERLYRLARQGVDVERPARQVFISQIVLHEANLPELTLEVHCASGTYIRSLVHDIGQALGCGAHMTALVRQASGSFSVDQAITPARLEAVVAEGRLADWLHPLDAAVQSMPAVELDADMTQRVRHGQRIQLPLVAGPACRAYDAGGALVAIMIYRAEVDLWQPDKVFSP